MEDWRKQLSEEEVQKHFTERSSVRGELNKYDMGIIELVRFVRNMWAHRVEQGFDTEIKLFNWVDKKWPWLWGLVVEVGKGEERLNDVLVRDVVENFRNRVNMMREYYIAKKRKEDEDGEGSATTQIEQAKWD